MRKHPDIKKVIEKLGGPEKTAEFFQCELRTVYYWMEKDRLPFVRQHYLRAVEPSVWRAAVRAAKA